MRGLRRAGAVVAAAATGAVMLAGMAHATTSTVNPSNLTRGADVKVLWADGVSIHPQDGGATVAMPSTPGAFYDPRQLLGGRASTGWVVWEQSYIGDPDVKVTRTDAIYRVRSDGSKHLIFQRSYTAPDEGSEGHLYNYWYALSKDGKRIAEYLGDYGKSPLIVRNTAGRIVGRLANADTLLDFSGPRLVYSLGPKTYEWAPGHKPHLVTKRSVRFADLKSNVIFPETSHGHFGPTSLSKPGKVRWSAPFVPNRISPNGKRVVGMGTGCTILHFCKSQAVQIRRMSDGKLLAQFRTSNPSPDLTWESNNAVVFPQQDYSRGNDATVAVRCTMSGVCKRASDWLDYRLTFSFPHTAPTAF